MLNVRNRLLIMLVLLTVAVSTSWVDAMARSSEISASGIVVSKPGAGTNTGEPDGSGGPGATPPPPIKFGIGPGGGVEGKTWGDAIRWASRIWAARVLGVRI